MNCCENFRKCFVNNHIFDGNGQMVEIYKKLYCEAGAEKIESCKRYQVMKRIGNCPFDILPNTIFSLENILVRVRAQASRGFR